MATEQGPGPEGGQGLPPDPGLAGQAIHLRHQDLKRYGDSAYKSVCPACKEGILAMLRSPETGELLDYDRCLLCGQVVVYVDLADLKTQGWLL